MALLTPARTRQGFFVFAGLSLIAYLGVLLYSNHAADFLPSLALIRWRWVLVGLVLASMDWFGGGLRLWVLAREVHERPPFWPLVIAGGMGAWAGYVTPGMTGSSPMQVYAMKRAGIPVPKSIMVVLMSFIATVAFFAIGGIVAVIFGAGKSLGPHGDVLGLSLLDLFKGSIGMFSVIGVLLLVVLIAPKPISRGVHWIATALGKRSTRIAARLESLRTGIDQAHESMVVFNTPRGWLSLFWATVVSGPSHANKLLAGYVVLRAIGIEVPFVDVLLIQTLVTSILYFAPTPGGAGFAELLSTMVMTLYLPRELNAVYTLLWKCILQWFTIGAGFVVFSAWVRSGIKGIEVPDT
jgi:glycosyltransferase 2 family protein